MKSLPRICANYANKVVGKSSLLGDKIRNRLIWRSVISS